MPAPATHAELFELIRKSGVLDDTRVKAYVDKLAASPEGLPPDPTVLGGLMVRDGLLTHFQAEQLLQGRWKRFSIGKYKVLERIGVGGMGQVFLCEHKVMKRRVAVKVLPAAKAKDEASLQRFYREARAVAAVDHPNIVRAYDIDDDNDLHFLVMEYVDGSNLHDLVRKSGPMPVVRACHYVYGSAVGLQHAHEMGLVHRDIKPANILVDRAGVVKILDMGLARFFHPTDDDHLTKKFDENVLGTADYLAPEQAIDSTGVDVRADIYGLGGTLYFLLTGQPPFPDGTIAQKLLWHQTKAPTPVRELRPDVPPELAAVVDRMLAKAREDRFDTPADVMAALVPWVQTAIAPPTEVELPKMSAAAGGSGRGPGGGGSGGLTPRPTAATPAPLAAKPPTPRPTQAGAVPPTPMATPALPVPAAPVQARPVAAPAADAAHDVWGSITDDTIPISQADTGRNTGSKPRRRAPAAPSGTRKKAKPEPAAKEAGKRFPAALVAVAAAGFLLVVGGAAAAVAFVWKPWATVATSPAAQAGDGHTLNVAASGAGPDGAAAYRTLAEAVSAAKPGDTVNILDDRIEGGPVRVTKGPGKGFRIQAGNAAKSVAWAYKPPSPARAGNAVLDLSETDGMAVSGLVIEVNGAHAVGVQVSGAASGTVIEDVTVRDAQATGVKVLNVVADAARPLRIDRCRVVGRNGMDAAVAVEGAGRLTTANVQVVNCRLEGPGAAGVRLHGSVTGCEVRNNRVFGFEAGLVVAKFSDGKFAVTADRNTFHTLSTAGVWVEEATAGRELTLTRNYFAATPQVGKIDADASGIKASDNGRDASQPGNLTPQPVEVPGVTLPKPTATIPDDQFLRAPGKLVVGPNKTPVGAE